VPTAVTPEFQVHMKGGTATCPLCAAVVRVSLLTDPERLEWSGKGCPHLKPFDFHREGSALFAVYKRV